MTQKGIVPDAGTKVPRLPAEEAEAIASGTHGNPFSVLGLQEFQGGFLARAFVPGADDVQALTLDGRPVGRLEPGAVSGLFEGRLAITSRQPLRYAATNSSAAWEAEDPYS
jgi:1,4-alpha-glucan branching enzyme